MYTGEIVRIGMASTNQKVNIARRNFGYEDEDIIAIFKYGKPVQIETLGGVSTILEREVATMEDALSSLLAHLEQQ